MKKLIENWVLKSSQHNLWLMCIMHSSFLFSLYFHLQKHFKSCPCHQKPPFTVNYSQQFFLGARNTTAFRCLRTSNPGENMILNQYQPLRTSRYFSVKTDKEQK